MNKKPLSGIQFFIFVGDVVVLLAVTLGGFASHDTLATGGRRFISTLIAWVLAWLLVAPHLGVFNEVLIKQPRQLWRPFWAMILASPLAGFLRELYLEGFEGGVVPLFVIVFGGIASLAILTWRGIYLYFTTRKDKHG